MRLHFPGILKMAIQSFASLLEEITEHEQAIALGNDPDGYHARRLDVLRHEVREHPAAAAGRDLPSIIGVLGG